MDPFGNRQPKNYGIKWHTPGCYVFVPGFFLFFFCMVGTIVYVLNEQWYDLYPLLLGFACVGIFVCVIGLVICFIWLCAEKNRLDLELFKISCKEFWTCKCSKRGCYHMCACCFIRHNKVAAVDPEKTSVHDSRSQSPQSFIVYEESPRTTTSPLDQKSEHSSKTSSTASIINVAAREQTEETEVDNTGKLHVWYEMIYNVHFSFSNSCGLWLTYVNRNQRNAKYIFHQHVSCFYNWLECVWSQIWTTFFVQVGLRTEVPCTPSSTRPGFELMTSRWWQYSSNLL